MTIIMITIVLVIILIANSSNDNNDNNGGSDAGSCDSLSSHDDNVSILSNDNVVVCKTPAFAQDV